MKISFKKNEFLKNITQTRGIITFWLSEPLSPYVLILPILKIFEIQLFNLVMGPSLIDI